MEGAQLRRSFMDAAFGLVLPCPTALSPSSGARARHAADRGIPLIVQRIVRQIVIVDVAPEILLGPVGERFDLPDAAPLVALQLRGLGAGVRLLAPDAGDPGIHIA